MASDEHISHEYLEPGVFPVNLLVESALGCRDSITRNVTIEPTHELIIPNAFTPSTTGPGNGSYDLAATNNDIFFPYAQYIEQFEMYIFNRWGEQLFESRDIKIGWDGYFNGSLCQEDVYTYRIKIKFIDEKSIERFGNIMLFR